MVYYFSGTGNSQYVAECIAAELQEQAVDMAVCMKKRIFSPTLKEEESVGIVCATHFWGLPYLVEEFLNQFVLPQGHYVYFVATYGTTTGQVGYFAEKIMKQHQVVLNANYSVKMPDVWTPMFNLTDKDKIARQNKKSDEELQQVISRIKRKDMGNYMRHRIPLFLSKIYHWTYRFQRRTKHFHVEKQCIGCGLCAKNCPMEAIYISDGHPIWTQDQCTMCLRCLHSCPTFAIQYGNKTKKHGQYLHPIKK